MGSLTQHRSMLRLLTFLALSWIATAIIPSPPKIIAQPLSNSLLFQTPVRANEREKPFSLECEAKGEPQPTYNWMKNGQPFQWLANDSRMSQQPGRGTLVVTKPSDEDEGYYQCVATNEHGTALSNGLFVRKSELNPFPDEPSTTRVVNEWDPLTLVCSPPTGFPKPTIFWVIQSHSGALRSIDSSRITFDPEGRLHFSSVMRDDGYDDAYYACSVFSVFRNEYKLGNRVNLDVMYSGTSSVQTRHPPVEQFTSPPNILVMRTHSLEIHCIFGGTPLPNIRWKKRGSELPRDRYKTINYGKTLRLKNVNFDDEGVYECTVSNEVGYAQSRTMNVTVQSAPYWISYPKDTNAAVEENVEFECRAAGVPEPEIKWFVNGEPLKEAKRNPRRKLLDNSILKIEMLEKLDTAVYQCNASNVHGYVFKNFFINVLVMHPEITKPPAETYEIVHGQSITLTCRAFGTPKPIVTWRREGRKLMGDRYITLDNGDLEIRNAYFMDAGHYSCKAENELGAVESDESFGNLKANVPSPPQIIAQPLTDLLLIQTSVEADEEETPLILDCEAKGEPQPTYKWTHNEEQITYNERISQQPGRGTLVIREPSSEDIGSYQCTATNEHGVALSSGVFVGKPMLNSFPDLPPITKAVNEWDPLTLKCRPPAGFPQPVVSWVIQSQSGVLRSIDSSRITVDPEGHLHFSSVRRDDGYNDAYYVCSASVSFLDEYKLGNKVKLDVLHAGTSSFQRHPPVEQFISPPNIIAMRTRSLELHCIFGGIPLPNIRWKKRDSELPRDRYKTINYGKTLRLQNVDFDDEGVYECNVSNGVGYDQSRTMNVTVQSAPYWISHPKDTNAAVEESVEFECRAAGVPEPEIKWFVNGVPLTEAKPNHRRKLIDSSTLKIEILEITDTAVYQCNATNTHGSLFKNFYINVLALPPVITESPVESYEIVDGLSITLTCRVFGAPKPIVTWHHEGRKLMGGQYITLDNGDLEIRNAYFMDTGHYNCKAENKLGAVESDESLGNLNVRAGTQIITMPVDYEIGAGQSATFRCNAVTDENLDLIIDWLHNEKLIDFDQDPRMFKKADYSLTIMRTQVLDSGTYTCVASTRLDNTTASATLIVQDVPNPPLIVGVDCNRRTAIIRWQPMGDNRSPILGFKIQYNTSFSPDNWEDALTLLPATDFGFEVPLSPWANYSFRVIAKNKIGESKPSEYSKPCQTPPDVPYKNPDNVVGKGTTPHNLVISWTPMPPLEHNAPGFFYRIYYRLDKSQAPWAQIVDIADYKTRHFEVSDQETFQQYRIKMEAFNSMGSAMAAAAEVIGFSGENVPLLAPSNLSLLQIIDGFTVELGWEPVPVHTVRGHFKGHKIQTWTARENMTQMRVTTVSASLTRTTIEYLVPNSQYNARILVFNGAHDGPASEVISFQTPEGKPGPVASFEAVALGAHALYLMWKRPIEENGILTGYRIYYQQEYGTKIGSLMERELPIADHSETRAKLGSLRRGTRYRITIRATTSQGEGDDYFIEASTRSNPPSPPDKPTFTWSILPLEDGAAGVRVIWLPNISGPEGNPGSHFYVQLRKKGDTDWDRTTEKYDEDSTSIKGLEPGTVYEMKVVSVDDVYETESSTEEIATVGSCLKIP